MNDFHYNFTTILLKEFMKKIYSLLIIAIILFFPTYGFSSGNTKKFTGKCHRFLGKRVSNGQIDYRQLQRDRRKLDQLTSLIAKASLSKSDYNERMAFYINAYNILVIDQIARSFPLRSPYEIEGFFDQNPFTIAGESLTLNQIEERKLLQPDAEIEVVFAICHGTIGSFPLPEAAFKPKKLEKQLSERARTLAKNEDYIRIKKNSSLVLLCEAFIHIRKFASKQDLFSQLSTVMERQLPDNYAMDYYPANRLLNQKTRD